MQYVIITIIVSDDDQDDRRKDNDSEEDRRSNKSHGSAHSDRPDSRNKDNWESLRTFSMTTHTPWGSIDSENSYEAVCEKKKKMALELYAIQTHACAYSMLHKDQQHILQ